MMHHSTDNFHSMKGQWQKGKLIGRGSFGSVYHATNLETGALCALKEVDLFPDDPKSADCIKQLDQEIRILGQLNHPNIVQYYGSEEVSDRLCIYMEFVHPGSLQKFMQEHCGPLTESVVRNFTRHILSGLEYLHSNNTIHRCRRPVFCAPLSGEKCRISSVSSLLSLPSKSCCMIRGIEVFASVLVVLWNNRWI